LGIEKRNGELVRLSCVHIVTVESFSLS
jgi:hypothetical protein